VNRASDQAKQRDYPVELFLAENWYITRDAVLNDFIGRSRTLLEMMRGVRALDGTQQDLLKVEVDRIVSESIGRKCHLVMTNSNASPFQRALWQAAIEVCPIAALLVKEFAKDDAVRGFSKKTSQISALGQLLKAHLYRRRIEATGGSEHEDRTWTKLADISNQLLDEYFRNCHNLRPSNYRCSGEHFAEVRKRILERHQEDDRLRTLKIETIEEYFLAHCAECVTPFDVDVFDPDTMDHHAIEAVENDPLWREHQANLPFLPELLSMVRPLLTRCTEALSSLHREVLQEEGMLGDTVSNVIPFAGRYTSTVPNLDHRIEEFCKTKGIERVAFEALLSDALNQLKDCLERSAREEWKP
jgi:hypothetical protein